jgi:predicted PurR-regulated permease PerM
LVSVIIAVTNIIPFFGPFIGAVPSAFLILLVSPMKCLYFLVFILLLQQFDGNILGPKILGQSTGLPSFWVLFSILFFGGLFGFVGMVIAVPAFAVLYSTVSRLVNRSLKKKNLSAETADYMNLQSIEEDKKTYKK